LQLGGAPNQNIPKIYAKHSQLDSLKVRITCPLYEHLIRAKCLYEYSGDIAFENIRKDKE